MTDHLHCSIFSGNGSSQSLSRGIAQVHDRTTADVVNAPDRQSDLILDIQSRQILDRSDDCINVLALEGRSLFVSRGGQVLLGIDDIAPCRNTAWIEFGQGADQQAASQAIAPKADGGNVNQQQTVKARFQQHIAKPVEPEQLIEAIVNLLENRQCRTN